MIRIIKDNLSELEKRQMETISSLQDKINLLEFDISQLKKQKQILKRGLFDRKETTKIAIKELEVMRKENNYKKISNILVILNSSLREKQ